MRPALSNVTPCDTSHENCARCHMGHVATHSGHSRRLSCGGHGRRSCIFELGHQEYLRCVELQNASFSVVPNSFFYPTVPNFAALLSSTRDFNSRITQQFLQYFR